MGRARQSGRAGVGGFLRLGHLGTDCYIFGTGEGGREGPCLRGPDHGKGRKTGGHVTRDAGQTTRGGAKKESERLVSGNGGDLLPPPPELGRSASSLCRPPAPCVG